MMLNKSTSVSILNPRQVSVADLSFSIKQPALELQKKKNCHFAK